LDHNYRYYKDYTNLARFISKTNLDMHCMVCIYTMLNCWKEGTSLGSQCRYYKDYTVVTSQVLLLVLLMVLASYLSVLVCKR